MSLSLTLILSLSNSPQIGRGNIIYFRVELSLESQLALTVFGHKLSCQAFQVVCRKGMVGVHVGRATREINC